MLDGKTEEETIEVVKKFRGVYMGEEEPDHQVPQYGTLLGGQKKDIQGATYIVQVLRDGLHINVGWDRLKDVYGNEISGKAAAMQCCIESGIGFTRVLRQGKLAGTVTVCAFFKEKGKLYILLPLERKVMGKKKSEIVYLVQRLYYPGGMGVEAPEIVMEAFVNAKINQAQNKDRETPTSS